MYTRGARAPFDRFLLFFGSNSVQPWLRLTVKKSILSQGHYGFFWLACAEKNYNWGWLLLKFWTWFMWVFWILDYLLIILTWVVCIAEKRINLNCLTNVPSYRDWAHKLFSQDNLCSSRHQLENILSLVVPFACYLLIGAGAICHFCEKNRIVAFDEFLFFFLEKMRTVAIDQLSLLTSSQVTSQFWAIVFYLCLNQSVSI